MNLMHYNPHKSDQLSRANENEFFPQRSNMLGLYTQFLDLFFCLQIFYSLSIHSTHNTAFTAQFHITAASLFFMQQIGMSRNTSLLFEE